MSFTPLPNQPIIFNEVIPCYTERDEYTYPVESGDTTEVGFELSVCEGTDSLAGIEVTSSDANWTADVDTYTSDGGNGAITFTLPVALNSKQIWKVRVLVEEYTSGELQLVVPGWGSEVMQANGEYFFYVSSNSPLFTYQLNSVGFIGYLYIDFLNPTWTEINANNRVDVIDSAGNVVETLLPTFYDNIALYSIDWSEYEIGCYRVAYVDGCGSFVGSFTGLCNAELTENTDCWTDEGVGTWSTTSGYATFWDADINVGLGRLVSDTLLESGLTYMVQYEITDVYLATFRLAFKGVDATTTFIDVVRSATGVYSVTYTPTVDGYIELAIFQGGTFEESPQIGVKNILVTIQSGFEYDGESPCICIGDEGTCGITLSGCFSNTMTVNGAIIPNDFFMKTRIPNKGREPQGRLFKKQYKADSIVYRNSQGRTDINYFDLTSTMVLRVEQLPTFMFDFIMLWLSFDEMYINGVSYRFAEDQLPVIIYDDKTELGSADIIVSPVRERTRKVLCGTRDQPCIESPSVNALAGMIYMQGDGMLYQDDSGMMFQ